MDVKGPDLLVANAKGASFINRPVNYKDRIYFRSGSRSKPRRPSGVTV